VQIDQWLVATSVLPEITARNWHLRPGNVLLTAGRFLEAIIKQFWTQEPVMSAKVQ
jgi:uncharacterized membrane protein YccC